MELDFALEVCHGVVQLGQNMGVFDAWERWGLRGVYQIRVAGVGLFTIAITLVLSRTLEGVPMGTSAAIKVGEAYRGGDVGPETVG